MPRLSIVMTPLNSTHPNFKWNVFILNFSIHHTIIKSVIIVFGRNDHRIHRIIVLVISQRPCETAHLCLKIGDVIGVNVFPSMLMRFPTSPQKGLKHPYYTPKIWFNIAQRLLSETAFIQLSALFASSHNIFVPKVEVGRATLFPVIPKRTTACFSGR